VSLPLIAVISGILIGLSLGALGAGGSMLAVPVLVYGLGQSPVEATTGSLVVVGATAVAGVVVAKRAGFVRFGQGVGFGLVAMLGAIIGAKLSTHIDGDYLMVAFSVIMLISGGVMVFRQIQTRGAGESGQPRLDDPIISFSPTFACQCPRALKVLVTATVVGLVTGLLGVGGGFLVVPALVVGLNMPMRDAVGTSLLVIALTSAVALGVRVGVGVAPDWGLVLLLTTTSAAAGIAGARLAQGIDTRYLTRGLAGLMLVVAAFTATQALQSL
jgi:uncharacterized protein